MATEAEIRASFAEQARFCAALDAPFTALLCETLGRRLDRSTETGRRVVGWPGDPSPFVDALALRLCGGLHFLARSGAAPALAAFYPPAPMPDAETLCPALAEALAHESLPAWLVNAPQTNEVGRSAVLMSGLLVVAARFGLPLRLFELGASAGLNLLLDRYGYALGGLETGDPASPVQLAPDWKGAPPPAAAVKVIGRAGTDLNPARLPDEGETLLAYVWPDQPARLARLEAALAVAATSPPVIERAGAANWIEDRLALDPEPGTARIVMHSVAFQYFGADSQRRVSERIFAAGERASATCSPGCASRRRRERSATRSGSGPGPAGKNCWHGRIRTATGSIG